MIILFEQSVRLFGFQDTDLKDSVNSIKLNCVAAKFSISLKFFDGKTV